MFYSNRHGHFSFTFRHNCVRVSAHVVPEVDDPSSPNLMREWCEIAILQVVDGKESFITNLWTGKSDQVFRTQNPADLYEAIDWAYWHGCNASVVPWLTPTCPDYTKHVERARNGNFLLDNPPNLCDNITPQLNEPAEGSEPNG